MSIFLHKLTPSEETNSFGGCILTSLSGAANTEYPF